MSPVYSPSKNKGPKLGLSYSINLQGAIGRLLFCALMRRFKARGRIIANIAPEDHATLESLLAKEDVVGQRVKIRHDKGRNIFSGLLL